MPEELFERPKAGFNVPISDFFRREWGAILEQLLAKRGSWEEIVRADQIKEILEMHRARKIDAGHELYGILAFLFWWNRFFK
jgi:asparagine synthase (glutamine-hydrolysing)